MSTLMRIELEVRMDLVESQLQEMEESTRHYGEQRRYLEAGICATTKEYLEGEKMFLRHLIDRHCPGEEAGEPEYTPRKMVEPATPFPYTNTTVGKLVADTFEEIMCYEVGMEYAHRAAKKLLGLDIELDDEVRRMVARTYQSCLPDQAPLQLDPHIRPAIEAADRILSRLLDADGE